MKAMNLISKIYIPKKNTGDRIVSTSYKFLLERGLIRNVHDGIVLLPLAYRSLKKLENIVHKHMRSISASQICLPTFTPLKLIEKSKKSDLFTSELFRVEGREKKNYVLSPSFEETITELFVSLDILNFKQLPIRLYQISQKFRDEMRSKHGMLRCKEFTMKDLYCFDLTEEDLINTFNEVNNQYHSFFQELQVPYVCVDTCSGDIGGKISYEYHFLSKLGSDQLLMCKDCGKNYNVVLCPKGNSTVCIGCKSKNIIIETGFEVGHTFMLGTRYSEPFKAKYKSEKDELVDLQMSSYGLGLTRIIAASIESLSDKDSFKWPYKIVPFSICVIPPKKGSKEAVADRFIDPLYVLLDKHFEDDVVVNDRIKLTIGARLHEVKQLGIPYAIVIGKKAASETCIVEIIDVYNESVADVRYEDVIPALKDVIEKNSSKKFVNN